MLKPRKNFWLRCNCFCILIHSFIHSFILET